MTGSSASHGKERLQLVTAKRRHFCWSWREKNSAPGDSLAYPDGKPTCTRVIEAGEKHALSTIYPGHESGYADAYLDRDGQRRPGRPLSSRFCLPCANRWENLRRLLDKIGVDA